MRALILAAGAGRRFGGPKQLAELDGRPLLAHVLELAAPWDPLVVLGAHAEEILAKVEIARSFICTEWEEGQAASLRAGVAALHEEDRILVLLGDQPWITRAAIDAVVGAGGCARATYDGAPGHPVVLDRAVMARVSGLRGDEGARSLLADCTEVEVGHLADPTDVDTPADLP